MTDTQLDFGRKIVRVGRQDKPIALLDARSLTVTLILAVLTVLLAIYGIFDGSASVTFAETLAALVGHGDEFTTMIVVEWRLPRIILAVCLGAALAMSGAIFQNLTGNPLGSPDVIGFQAGSYTGAIIVMLILQGGAIATMAGALTGGVLTAFAVFFLASQRGSARGVRLIIVGIGVSAMLASINAWILLTATVEDAIMASLWGAGNLSGSKWATVVFVLPILFALVVAVTLLNRPMRILQIGVPFATGLGLNIRIVQICAIVVGVGLTAVVTSTAGPISFIALAAPQIARRIARTDGLALLPTAATGAFLLLLADVVAQRINPASPLPVGIVTVSIGGIYFLWLLFREGRTK